jgi:hypothetical protein
VVELDKALYGTIEAARLWYDLLSMELKGQGFVPTLDTGEQMTVAVHVDDMMVTCEVESALDDFVAFLRRRFGEDKVAEHRGKVLDFLGMTFNFETKGEARVTMKRLVDEIIAGSV